MIFPFNAVVGQDRAKKAVLLNLVAPQIGGLLLSGEKGTAKSILLRAAAAILPELQTVNVPLNTSEEALVGSFDLGKALKEKEYDYEPGLLARAHNNILYIDEVNLLDRAVSSLILDAASAGMYRLERDGLSRRVKARFILFGSMNPEEGALHPQLLDRFGLFTEMKGERELDRRKEIIRRRLLYESDPDLFSRRYQEEEKKLSARVIKARSIFEETLISKENCRFAASLCSRVHLIGHRGDVVLAAAARGIAALDSRNRVTREDILEAAAYVFPHRRPPEDENRHTPPPPQKQNETPEEKDKEQEKPEPLPNGSQSPHSPHVPNKAEREEQQDDEPEQTREDQVFTIKGEFLFPDIPQLQRLKPKQRFTSGKRETVRSETKRGHYVRFREGEDTGTGYALVPTIRAAVLLQKGRSTSEYGNLVILPEDLRIKIRERQVGNTILFLVDASGSMGASRRMAETKGAVFSLLKNSYRKRDRVGMMVFRRNAARLILQPTRSLDLAHKKLKELAVGGNTPLALGLRDAAVLIKAMAAKEDGSSPVLVLLTDGRGNVSLSGNREETPGTVQAQGNMQREIEQIARSFIAQKVRVLVIDTETGWVRLGGARRLAEELDGVYLRLDEFKAEKLAESVRSYIR